MKNFMISCKRIISIGERHGTHFRVSILLGKNTTPLYVGSYFIKDREEVSDSICLDHYLRTVEKLAKTAQVFQKIFTLNS